jgi:hypothetical protein
MHSRVVFFTLAKPAQCPLEWPRPLFTAEGNEWLLREIHIAKSGVWTGRGLIIS